MRGLFVLASSLLGAGVACQSGPTGQRAAAAIDATCKVVADGAICELTNAGGRGERCFRVLLGARRTGSVIESDEACSGTLVQGAKVTVAVRFPRRPALVCGPSLETDCATKVVDPASSETDAVAWQKELRPAGGGAAGRVDCKVLGEHVYALRLEEELSYAQTDEERENTRAWMEGDKAYIVSDNTMACESGLSPAQARCMLAASTYDALRACWDLEVEEGEIDLGGEGGGGR